MHAHNDYNFYNWGALIQVSHYSNIGHSHTKNNVKWDLMSSFLMLYTHCFRSESTKFWSSSRWCSKNNETKLIATLESTWRVTSAKQTLHEETRKQVLSIPWQLLGTDKLCSQRLIICVSFVALNSNKAEIQSHLFSVDVSPMSPLHAAFYKSAICRRISEPF